MSCRSSARSRTPGTDTARRLRAAALAALVALACAPAPAAEALDQRLRQLRDQSRFVPDQALAELLRLQPRAAAEAPRVQAELLSQLSTARMRLNQNDAALALAEQLIAYGKAQRDNAILATGLMAKAETLSVQTDNTGAPPLVFEAERLALGTGELALQVRAEVMAGETRAQQGDFPSALVKLQTAVTLARRVSDDPVQLVAALNALTYLYMQMKDSGKAFATLDELLAETAKLNSPGRMARAKTAEYMLASGAGQTRRALKALLECLELYRELGAQRLVTNTLGNLADAYLQQRDYPQAARYASEALHEAVLGKHALTEATARINLGQAYLGMGRIAEGKQSYETGMAWIERSNDKPELQATLLEYGEALERAGDMAGAVQAYHRERALSNELFEARRRQAMLELEQKYDTDKKQRQIELLSRENRIKNAEIDHRRLEQRVWWLLALVFALATAVAGLLYRKVRNANMRLAVKNLELKAQSTLDPLTALYNRRHFQDFMRARGQDDSTDAAGALFLLDVDHFKRINDTHGHAAGDIVLKMIADSLRVALRGTDMIVRWGGEEFLAYLPAIPHARLDDVARRILVGVASQTMRYQEHAISVNVSIGFAPFPLAPDGAPLAWERVVNLADMALYLAKSHGRNRAYGVRGFENFQQTSMEAIERDLELAWRAGHVSLSVVLGEAPGSPPPLPSSGNAAPAKSANAGR
jgi:diguanylate cyclase (GGDEF)-like protein